MALHPCPICKTFVPVGVSYCASCKPIAEARAADAKARRQAQYNRQYNKRRDPKYGRFYNSKEWRLLSRVKLQSCGYKCEAKLAGCTGLAYEAHHVKPIKTPEGWNRRLDPDNLMGVCGNCHNILDGKKYKKKAEPGVIDLNDVEKNLKSTPRGG